MNRKEFVFTIFVLFLATVACGVSQQADSPTPIVFKDTIVPEPTDTSEPVDTPEPVQEVQPSGIFCYRAADTGYLVLRTGPIDRRWSSCDRVCWLT